MDFYKQLLEVFESDTPTQSIEEILIQMRESGYSGEDALQILTRLRDYMASKSREEDEDVVLSWMDIASGWCSPNNRIWPPQKTESMNDWPPRLKLFLILSAIQSLVTRSAETTLEGIDSAETAQQVNFIIDCVFYKKSGPLP